MPDPQPTRDEVPGSSGHRETYRAAGKLRGKRAIITGGDSGIGASTALLFAREGAVSTIAYLPEEEKDAQDTRNQIQDNGGTCYLVALDLVRKENCKKVVDFALENMGGVDILFNNAACEFGFKACVTKSNFHLVQMVRKDISDLSEDQWEHTFNINIHAYFYMAKYCLEHMTGGATIINNASINAYIGRPDLLDYTSTKGAVVSFTRGLSNQCLAKDIRVNAVAPGPGT